MRVFTARVEMPENALAVDIEDALISAKWTEHHETDLDDKCGSCKFFKPFESDSLKFHGECEAGRVWGARTRPKCKAYERKEG